MNRAIFLLLIAFPVVVQGEVSFFTGLEMVSSTSSDGARNKDALLNSGAKYRFGNQFFWAINVSSQDQEVLDGIVAHADGYFSVSSATRWGSPFGLLGISHVVFAKKQCGYKYTVFENGIYGIPVCDGVRYRETASVVGVGIDFKMRGDLYFQGVIMRNLRKEALDFTVMGINVAF